MLEQSSSASTTTGLAGSQPFVGVESPGLQEMQKNGTLSLLDSDSSREVGDESDRFDAALKRREEELSADRRTDSLDGAVSVVSPDSSE